MAIIRYKIGIYLYSSSSSDAHKRIRARLTDVLIYAEESGSCYQPDDAATHGRVTELAAEQ